MAEESAAPSLLAGLLSRARSARTVDGWARALRLLHDFIVASAAPVDFRHLSESDWLRFVDFCISRGLAASTVNRLWSDTNAALALLGFSVPSSRRLLLVRAGLSAVSAVPKPQPSSASFESLLLAWRGLPSDSRVRRRDRALILLTLLLGARPIDVTTLGRTDSFLSFFSAGLKLRLFRDKGSRLGGRTASRWLVLFDSEVLPVSRVLRDYIADVPLTRVHPFRDPSTVFFPLFVRLDRARFGYPLDPGTISKIISRFLVSAGISPANAQASRVRAFAASAAHELGVGLQEVCLHFRWESPATFLRHYFLRNSVAPLSTIPAGPRDGSRVSLVFSAALRRALSR